MHRQSPIDLHRDRSIPGHRNEKECPDWHYMQYRDDTCDWSDMEDQFEIARHALKINIPIQSNGDIDCVRESDGFRQFPRLDYSKGFPDWFWLDHIEITVPSSHTQEGKRYAAEVILAHFYQIDHPKNQVCPSILRTSSVPPLSFVLLSYCCFNFSTLLPTTANVVGSCFYLSSGLP